MPVATRGKSLLKRFPHIPTKSILSYSDNSICSSRSENLCWFVAVHQQFQLLVAYVRDRHQFRLFGFESLIERQETAYNEADNDDTEPKGTYRTIPLSSARDIIVEAHRTR